VKHIAAGTCGGRNQHCVQSVCHWLRQFGATNTAETIRQPRPVEDQQGSREAKGCWQGLLIAQGRAELI
jgi:hypothetical protein